MQLDRSCLAPDLKERLDEVRGKTYCVACFTGDYRAPLVDAEAGLAMSSHC